MIKYITYNGERYAVKNTKRVKEAYDRYLDSDYYYLHQVYNTWSDTKEYIFNEWSKKINGLKIISFNINVMTFGGYIIVDNVKYFVYITPSKNEALQIEVLK